MLADQVHHSVNRLQQFTAPTPGIALGMYLMQHEVQGIVRLVDGFAGLARRLNVSRATLYRSLAGVGELTAHFSYGKDHYHFGCQTTA